LLFGSTRLVRNLSITGKRKLPRKEVYIEVKPEVVELKSVLNTLGLNREQLITLGMLIGTDYNPGIKGVGPKTALTLVKEHRTLQKVLQAIEWQGETDPKQIFQFFLNPPVTKEYELEWKPPNPEKIVHFMVKEHDFSQERVEKVVNTLQKAYSAQEQKTLAKWA